MGDIRRLTAAELYRHCDPEQFTFETTSDLEDLTEIIGQPRAVTAMEFGVGIDHPGYNIFALGPEGTGKRAVVRQYFEQQAASGPVPHDQCYVNNFDEPHRPHALSLPAGRAVAFRADTDQLIDALGSALAAAFESEEYQTRRQTVLEELQQRQSQAFEHLQNEAQQRGVALLRTPAGLAIAPTREGEVLTPEQIKELSDEERSQLEGEVEELQGELQKIVRQMPAWQRETQENLKKLNREIATYAVSGLIDEVRQSYSEFPKVVQHLDALQQDVIENAADFLASDEKESGALREAGLPGAGGGREAALRRYRVNVLVDHSSSEGAPVVYEDNPTYQNLVGRVEHRAHMGTLLTDFNLIKPGALHRANGGYLILDGRKVLTQPYAWEGLKRALQSRQIRIESVGQMLSVISTVSLEPEPIELNVKVALCGDRLLYYLLWQLEPDFGELFKVAADFDEQMDGSPENQQLYARLLATLIRREGLRPFDRAGAARVIERSARMVGDASKLSTEMRSIADLLREADYWAGRAGREVVSAGDVQQAINAHIYRSDRLRERVQEEILRGTLLIDTAGERIGQVNGLSVAQLGGFAFGRPSRITARVQMGKGQVVDIEREVELGGPIHSKGVLILSSFLGARYAADNPLSLSASLVFEQSYSGVEGDSASSAELYALLSAVADLPIKQSLAVTGSVNQHGQVQAIGGVNEKIEGFFDLCRSRGLNGDQGVLIPSANVKHLMLRQDVVSAVEAGEFCIYAVDTIDQGIEILTGLPAGQRDKDGNYPEGTVNHRVEQRLAELARKRRAFGASAREDRE